MNVLSPRCLQVASISFEDMRKICCVIIQVKQMTTSRIKSIMTVSLMVMMSLPFIANASTSEIHNSSVVEVIKKSDEFKHGQYVYVTLKDGSETVGKVVGKKNSKKYYVNQLNGSHHGTVHKKYIRKMTKEEVDAYKASKKKM